MTYSIIQFFGMEVGAVSTEGHILFFWGEIVKADVDSYFRLL